MPNGTLTDYVNANPHADRISLVRIQCFTCFKKLKSSKLLDVAEGLNYLHTCHMLHGDLKGVSPASPGAVATENLLTFSKPNILIDGRGHARVSDFGLASIAHGKYSTGVKSDKGHTVRWSAPEILFGIVPASKQADIFAFGMVVVEVCAAFL